MRNRTSWMKSKIGYCNNNALRIGRTGGHYVYIRKVNRNGTCDVSTFTSLDRNNRFQYNKLHQVRNGNIYSIPKNDADFREWTGCNKNVIRNVPIRSVQNIGRKRIKRRHLFMIGKNT